MELIAVTAEYDDISDRMRQFAAQRLMELIESLRPAVAEAVADQLADVDSSRIQAHVALIKLYNSLIKELGLLYRVQDRPREQGEETMTISAVHQLLQEQEARTAEAVAAAAAAALEQGRLEARTAEVLSLQEARERVQRGLLALGG